MPPDLYMKGETILHYKIGERLGKGGMGEVYLAKDTRLGREVALKFLPASYRYDLDRRERFLREARAASSLSSPSIAAIYEIGESDDSIFIAMEYVEGETLSHRIKSGPVPVREAIAIAMQMADALDEAHTRGIIHSDIKSSNIIITPRGLAKLLDFGLAKLTESFQTMFDENTPESDNTLTLGQQTAAGIVLGTVSYMSPEQALGRAMDHRSDIFSLGVVIYEMLTARVPFEGESITEVIDKIVNAEPAALARFNYDAPPEIERIARKAMGKDLNFRYQTARELYIDLSNLGRDLKKTDSSGTALYRHARRSDTSVIETASRPQIANAVAVMSFSNITGEAADDWIGTGIAETVTADLKNIRGLSVIGRERIFETLKNLSLGDRNDTDEIFVTEVGRGLGAAWIISGGYQRLGEMIRITARVVNVESGTLLKAIKIDGEIKDIFALQDKIVYELSQGLNLKLNTSDLADIERNKSESVEAYECYSRGMINIRIGSHDSLDRAMYLLEKATGFDPNYANAWAAMGAAYGLKGAFLSLPEFSMKAIEFERKAIELNPRLSNAYVWISTAYTSLGRYDEAIEAVEQAIQIDPADDLAYVSLARAYSIGKGMIKEAITSLELATAINHQAGYAYLQLGILYTLREDYEQAEQASRKAIELQEQNLSGMEGLQIVGAHTRLGYIRYRQGRYGDAIREYEREREFLSSSDHALRARSLIELHQKLGAAHLRDDRKDEAERYFDLALKGFREQIMKGADEPFTKYYIACLYALRGDDDSAIKYLEQSLVHLPAFNALRARTDPDFDSIRSDPRFIRILESA